MNEDTYLSLDVQIAVMEHIVTRYPSRTGENILQNLKARKKEGEE